MPEYRLYCLDGAGNITRAHEIMAPNDGDALARAKAMDLGIKCELWERRRLVAEIPAHPA